MQAVAAAGAAYCGLNFFPPSPRYLTLAEGRALALAAPVGLAKVALTVDAGDEALDAIVEAMPLDMLQLHGHESPDRVAAGSRPLWPAGDEGHRGAGRRRSGRR